MTSLDWKETGGDVESLIDFLKRIDINQDKKVTIQLKIGIDEMEHESTKVSLHIRKPKVAIK